MLTQEYNVESPLYDSAAFIPANYNYLNLELSSQKLHDQNPQSFILPFLDHSATIAELVKGLIQRTNLQEKYPFENLRVSLREGNPLKMEIRLQELRIMLCRQSASGVTLRVKAVFKKLQDEAAMECFIYNQSDFNHGKINKWFLLLNNQEPFCISIPKDIHFHKLEAALCDSLNHSYKNQISPPNLSFFAIEKEQEGVEFSWRKTRQLQIKQVCLMILQAQHRMVGVEAVKQGANWPVSEVESEEYLIFHIRNDHKLKLRFSLIAKYTVSQLLQHLQIEHINNNLGIKIVDQIFAPCRVLKEAEGYFRTGDGQFAKNVECRLVSEREMFYASIANMSGDFTLPKEMVTVDKEKMYDQCRDLAQRKIQEEREKSEQPLFKTVDEIHPITLYTSSINVIDQETKSAPLLYRALNDFLRIEKFGLRKNHSAEWRYQFSARLIKSLLRIKPFDRINPETKTVTVYRGIRGHQLQGEKGQLYVAKQFLSTSISKEKATNFTKHSPIGTIIQIQCLSGRQISQYSKYQKEQEVLFMPYTYFRIVEKDTSSPIFKMKLVQLQQKPSKSNPATQILWVDDKLKEGEKVIASLNCPMHTTFLHQLKSTKALQEWIDSNQHIVTNKNVKIAVISNMRRIEDEKEVVDAGAKTVLLVRQKLPQSDIVLYIYNVQGTKAKLVANNIDPNSVKIFTKRAELRPFIAACCAPLVEEEQKKGDDLVFETIQSVLHKSSFSHTSSKVSSKSEQSSP